MNKKRYARFKIGSTVYLKKYYEGLPPNYQLVVRDNEKKTYQHKKYCIEVTDNLIPKNYHIPVKYLNQ